MIHHSPLLSRYTIIGDSNTCLLCLFLLTNLMDVDDASICADWLELITASAPQQPTRIVSSFMTNLLVVINIYVKGKRSCCHTHLHRLREPRHTAASSAVTKIHLQQREILLFLYMAKKVEFILVGLGVRRNHY